MSQNYAICKNKPVFIASVSKILEYWSLLLYFWPLLKLTQNNFPEFECVYRKHGTGCFSTNGSVFGIKVFDNFFLIKKYLLFNFALNWKVLGDYNLPET